MWDVDFVQFARLLDEINAIGLSPEQTKALATSMEITSDEVGQILNRATNKWSSLKPLLVKKTPLTEDQVSEELAENGTMEAIVTMGFEEVIGQLEDVAVEAVFDDLAERVATVPLANIDYKVLFADDDTLYIKVTATADDMEDDEEEVVEPTV